MIVCLVTNLTSLSPSMAYLQMNTSQYRHIPAGGLPPPLRVCKCTYMLCVVKMTNLHLLPCRTHVSNVLSCRMVFVSGQSAIYWIALLIILLTTSFDCVNVTRGHNLNCNATCCSVERLDEFVFITSCKLIINCVFFVYFHR